MKTLLINAHPNPSAEQSFSNRMLQHLASRLPAADTDQLTLYQADIPELNGELMAMFEKLGNGDDLSTPEQQQAQRLAEIMQQFKAARRVVISLPMYNFNVPSRLKSYIDSIIVPNQTFRYTEQGPVGLMNDGRKLLILQASGSVYSQGALAPMELSVPYLRIVFEDFLGFDSVAVIRAEGTQEAGVDPARLFEQALAEIDARLPAFLAD
ncbi:MAG: NAD(P)H-dependent oxidoreductase [Lautropia sp.]|nr:NAD(P)H-dependent oxidoreductase [Lautropia sp.]